MNKQIDYTERDVMALLKEADIFEQRGLPVSATYRRNEAWTIQHGSGWMIRETERK